MRAILPGPVPDRPTGGPPGRGLSRGRGEGRQNRAPARCGVGGLSARLDGVHIRIDQQRGDFDDSKPVHTSPPGAAGSAARRPRAQARQRPAGPDVGSLLAGRPVPVRLTRPTVLAAHTPRAGSRRPATRRPAVTGQSTGQRQPHRDRAGAGGEDQISLVGLGGVGIGGTGEQPGTADKLHGHAPECAMPLRSGAAWRGAVAGHRGRSRDRPAIGRPRRSGSPPAPGTPPLSAAAAAATRPARC